MRCERLYGNIGHQLNDTEMKDTRSLVGYKFKFVIRACIQMFPRAALHSLYSE